MNMNEMENKSHVQKKPPSRIITQMGKKKGWEIWEFRATPFGNIQLVVSTLTEPANVIWNLHHHSSFLLTIKNIPNHQSGTNQNMNMVGARIIERKLRSTKVRLFTVPCCSIILFSSEGMKKNVS